MKLSMRSELTQDERDDAKSPSDLAHYLQEQYDSPLVLQARLIYTLEILGHRSYGYRAVRKLEESYKPPPFDIVTNLPPKVDKEEFLLYQYLATACRLIPQDCCEHFIYHCAEKLEGYNHNMFTTPCEVLTTLLQETVLKPDNHVDFMEDALIEAGVPESTIQKYNTICNKITSM